MIENEEITCVTSEIVKTSTLNVKIPDRPMSKESVIFHCDPYNQPVELKNTLHGRELKIFIICYVIAVIAIVLMFESIMPICMNDFNQVLSEISDESLICSDALNKILNLIRCARHFEIILLITQLSLYYFQYGKISQTLFVLLFSTNLMTLFIILIHNMNTFEIHRLTALWSFFEYKSRFKCLIEVFTLSIFATLRFLLANLNEIPLKKTHFITNDFETNIQLIYSAELIISTVENVLLFVCVFLFSSSQKIFQNVNFVPQYYQQQQPIRRNRDIFQTVAQAA